MVARGSVLGMLILSPEDASKLQGNEIRPIATALADGMSLALSNIALRERLLNQALRDGLTGLYNRRYMEDALERLVDASGSDGPVASIVMVDLDHFKSINDSQGHALGDSILREVGSLMLAGLRKTDVACRYGGEELVLVLPNCDHSSALQRAEAVRTRIESLSDHYGFQITASLGVATTRQNGGTVAELMAAADAALYGAKAAGRNTVVGADAVRRVAADIPAVGLQQAA